MRHILHTIGYEGASIADFLDTLVAVGVAQVLDIRDVPISRKPGFSKRSLSAAAASRGIVYEHLKDLGDPKAGREAMRRGDYAGFLEIYSRHLATDWAQRALARAVELASERVSVLLCFERSPKECHRSIVASAMKAAAGFDVRELGVKNGRGAARAPTALAQQSA